MSFHILPAKSSSVSYKRGNDTKTFLQVVPSKKLLSEIPFSGYLDIKPIYSPKGNELFLEAIADFAVNASDIFVCSLPKCGSSWTHSIVWLLTHGLHYKDVDTIYRTERIQFDSAPKVYAAKEKACEILKNDSTNSITEDAAHKMAWNEVFNTSDTPRVIKTHSQVYCLPKKIWQKGAKIVYIARNPKDMIVSYHHYLRATYNMDMSLDDTVDTITSDTYNRSPHLNHVLNFWRVRHLLNVLFVSYEDLVMNSFATIKKISDFLECKYTDNQLGELTDYVSFDKMKNNVALNREEDIIRMENRFGLKRPDSEFKFLRKGKVGGYRDELNEEQIEKIDNWTEKWLDGTDFRFKI